MRERHGELGESSFDNERLTGLALLVTGSDNFLTGEAGRLSEATVATEFLFVCLSALKKS